MLQFVILIDVLVSILVSGLLKTYQEILELMPGKEKFAPLGTFASFVNTDVKIEGHRASTEPSKKKIFTVTLNNPLSSGSGQFFFFLAPEKSALLS